MRFPILKTTILFLFVCVVSGTAQICSGSLGENIFDDGDFGSGSSTILSNDPGIAPGYIYETNPPPDDGYYVITNNTGNWGFNYETWLDIGDNSEDPLGYMMIVNASFQPGLFYDQEVTGLCENTLYVFSVDVINLIRVNVTDHILPNVSFLINDEVVFDTGNIPQDEAWHMYGFTFTTAPGQTSVRLSLQNNAPGGIGNDLALDNISFQACGPTTVILPDTFPNVCENNSLILEASLDGNQYDTPVIQWQQSVDGNIWENIEAGNNFTLEFSSLAEGNNYIRFLVANSIDNLNNPKCHVISEERLIELPPVYFFVEDTICAGSQYEFGNRSLNTSGMYIDTFTSIVGCDSIVQLSLTTIPPSSIGATWMTSDQSCSNINDGSIEIFPVEGIAEPFIVYLNNQVLQTPYIADSLAQGIYDLVLEDRFGCTFREEVQVFAPDPFLINIGNDTSVQSGSSVLLRINYSEPISSVILFPDSTICALPCSMINYTPVESINLIAAATSLLGCVATDSIFIEVNQDRAVYFPNVFSPNGDGQNDYFTGFGRAENIVMIESLSIFDRWGNLIVELSNLSPNSERNGWDGKIGNEDAGIATYIYSASVLFLDGQSRSYSGSITLIR